MERVRALIGPLDSPTLSGYRVLPGFDCLVYRRGQNPFALELCVDPQGRVVETIDRRRYERRISSLRYEPSASTLHVNRGEVDRLLRKMGADMTALKVVFWGSLAALAWTHAGYPAAASALARVRRRPVRRAPVEPTVAVIVAAYNEEAVIERRIENLRALDYPAEKLELVVTADAPSDRTVELARAAGVRVIENPRGGKVAAQDRAVRETESELVAFSDANATWAPDALRLLVRSFADPDVAYACGRLVLGEPDGRTRRASTGATSWRCARRSRSSGRSPAATARSTRSGARTTPRSTRASGTTSRCPTCSSSAAAARSTTRRRSRSSSRRPRTRRSTGARCGCSSTAG